MSGISSTIRLSDAMTPVLVNITGALHATLDAFSAFQTAANVNMNTASFDAATASIQEADIALAGYQERLNQLNHHQPPTPPIPPTPPQPPVPPMPPQWQNLNTQQIFMNTGTERFLEEMNAANNAAREVLLTQQQISTQAINTHLLPTSALNDFNNVQEKVHIVQSTLMELSNTPPYLRTDAINNQIESIRQQMQGVNVLQNQVSNAVINMDITGANSSLQQLNGMIDSVMRNVRAVNAQQITPQWQSIASPQVFTNTGAERFQAEINAANNAMQRMLQVQAQVRASTASMRMIPPNARADMTIIETRMQNLARKIQEINRIPVSMRTETLNNQLEGLRGQFFQATQSAEALNRAMQGGDLSAANTAAQQINSTLGTAERIIRDNINAQNNFNQSVHQGTAAANGLESMIKRYGAAILSFAGVKKVLNLSDTLTQSTARINLMTGGLEDVGTVQDQIFAAAQRARGNYQEMLNMVGSFGVRAKTAFSSTAETIKFVENLNKLYVMAGTAEGEAAGATLQLTQALGSGVLRGQELNSVFKAAPNLIQIVADYMGVGTAKIREAAMEGKLSANVVKDALLGASAQIEEDFAGMPMTFAQVANSVANQTLMAFRPVLTQISDITSSARFQSATAGIVNGLASVASVATQVFDGLATGVAVVYDNWSIIEPIVLGVATAFGVYTAAVAAHNVALGIHNGLEKLATFQEATHAAATMLQSGATFGATAAQHGFNAALMACPITWIVVGIIALIAILYSVVAVINKVTGDSISATGLITGTLSVALAAVKNTIYGAIELVFGLIEAIVNPIIAFANFLENLFNDPIGSIIHLFVDMADAVLGIIEKLASAIDMVFGSSLASHVAGWRENLSAVADDWANKLGNGTYEATYDTLNMDNLMAELGIDLQRSTYTDAWDTGYNWGASFGAADAGALLGAAGAAGIDLAETNDLLGAGNYNTAALADSTHDITDSLEISNEDIKYLKDIAERDYINRFTTAEIKIDIGGINNTISEAQDLDGAINNMIYDMVETAQMSAAGYHNY